ncbi:MAG TPA: hypothetical protein VNO32_39550 [Candidatus Acidoferrum sp.]|nr:hypothetical protein [Candidatus Acidoferrum sp.]
MSTVLANPAKMIARGAPHVIHSDDELDVYTDALFRLTALENPSASEVEAIELLTLLVERYEQAHYSHSTDGCGFTCEVPHRKTGSHAT